jgi:hypothetical protein
MIADVLSWIISKRDGVSIRPDILVEAGAVDGPHCAMHD